MDCNQRRAEARRLYGDLFDRVSAVLLAADPIGINFGVNPDEYDPEVGTILPRLRECRSVRDVQDVVYQEFVRWFDQELAGPPTEYLEPAEQIWQLWQQYIGQHRPT